MDGRRRQENLRSFETIFHLGISKFGGGWERPTADARKPKRLLLGCFPRLLRLLSFFHGGSLALPASINGYRFGAAAAHRQTNRQTFVVNNLPAGEDDEMAAAVREMKAENDRGSAAGVWSLDDGVAHMSHTHTFFLSISL